MPSGYCERGLRPKSRSKGLTKTVPPSGVNLSKFSDATWSTQVKTAKQNDQTLPVPHTLVTQYWYNSLNQVVEQISPDGGLSKFWYDRLGRLVFSQNAKQVLLNQYSYTRYDNLGRIEEVGQLTSATAMTQATAQSSTATTTWWTTTVNNSREQITKTVYDLAFATLCTPAPSVLCQKNLRNRVSYTYVQPSASYSNIGLPYTSASYYSYDIHGNVDVLLQHYNSGVMQTVSGNAFKRIEYKYDLISGKVNEVAYQPGYSDQFYHRYSYDAENKLTKVFTSPDRVVWEQEADYSYYRHGPLARVELGQVGVQGVDYAYTLQGWLKTVNSTAVSTAADMGGDGTLTGRKIAADVYGFALHYNSTDYKAINLAKTVVAPVTSTGLPAFKDLYNGNIAAMAVTFKHTSFGANNTSGLNQPLLYKYRYDQLNRIKEMDAYSGLNQATNAWTFGSPLTAYQERVSYDGNGNILTYTRNGDAARTAMDNMTYSYVSGTNRLDKVVDVAPDATSNYSDYNDLRTGQLPGNYSYDAIGNLIVEKEKIGTNTVTTNITWNVYGKIASVTKGGVTTSYTYDASGNRISKTTGSKTTWYVRDASGNVMAVYESGNASVNGGNLSQIEVHLYGSSRLGMWTPNRNVQVIPSAQNTTMIGVTNGVGVTRTYKRGQKFFELSNHLGNVLVTVTDRKVAIQNGTTGTILNYVADVVSGGDYYPFGMQMPGRKINLGTYRFGFQGQEKDDEIKGEGNSINYTFRVYDPRIGKFLSRDPLTEKYPFYSPYHFSSNQPIHAGELEGLESEFDLNLPSSSNDVDANHWQLDPTHKNPNGMKWKDVNGNTLYYDKAQFAADGKPLPGWKGKDHFHFEDANGNRYSACGNIVKSKKANESHLNPGTQTSIKVKASVTTTAVNGVSATTTKTKPTPKTTTQKINGTIKSVFIIADIASTVTGIATGNPDALINQFGGARVGQLKSGTLDPYEMGFRGFEIREDANYFMITNEVIKEWTENGTKYKTVTRYLQHYEGKQKVNGKYVGQGEIGPVFNQTQTYKDGKLIDKGKLNNPDNIM